MMNLYINTLGCYYIDFKHKHEKLRISVSNLGS